MSEPLLSDDDREALKWAAENGDVTDQAVLARLNWCEAQLAALAPLQDLLKDVREDNELRRTAEIGAARAREDCARRFPRIMFRIEALTCGGARVSFQTRGQTYTADMVMVKESDYLDYVGPDVSEQIRNLGPCLPPLPEESEIERLRKIEAAARDLMKLMVQPFPLPPKYAELAEALGLDPQVELAFGEAAAIPAPQPGELLVFPPGTVTIEAPPEPFHVGEEVVVEWVEGARRMRRPMPGEPTNVYVTAVVSGPHNNRVTVQMIDHPI